MLPLNLSFFKYRFCNGIHASPLAGVSSTTARSSSTVARSNPQAFGLFVLEKNWRLETGEEVGVLTLALTTQTSI